MPDTPLAKADVESLVFESDWLASRPFFYNVKTGRASENVNDVIDLVNAEFDPEGFNDYLDLGMSAFGRTPLRDVHTLRYSSRLYSGPRGLRVEHLDDPAEEWLDRRSTVDEVLGMASVKVNDAAASDAEIVVPTSGGLDSRLIDVLLTDRRRVRTFTYGINDHPERSFETVKARELAERLGLRWELIPLGDFHRYFDEWDALFGISTHAHGMYHIEFYRAIRPRVAQGSMLLSGVAGDWFAGNDDETHRMGTIDGVADVMKVLWTGGLVADSNYSRFKSEHLGAQRLLEEQPRFRTEPLPRTLAVVRVRMALLSYLLTVPAFCGLRPRAPLADIEVAMRMLTLPTELRDGRRWQHEFFARQGLDLESESLDVDFRNTLNFRGMRRAPLRPLDAALLSEVVEADYVRWVNRWVGPLGRSSEALYRLGWVPGFRRAVEALRPTGWQGLRLRAYGAYLTLKPIETLLRRRERARRGGDPAENEP